MKINEIIINITQFSYEHGIDIRDIYLSPELFYEMFSSDDFLSIVRLGYIEDITPKWPVTYSTSFMDVRILNGLISKPKNYIEIIKVGRNKIDIILG